MYLLKLSAYADDVVIPVDSQQDVDVLVRDVVQFGSLSSAKVNWDKSEAVSVGGVEKKLSVSGGLIWKTPSCGLLLGQTALGASE